MTIKDIYNMKKRSDGRYQKSIMIGRDDNGKPIRKVVYGRTLREIKDKEFELRGLIKKGIRIDENMTFGEAAELWLNQKESEVRPSTINLYREQMQHLEPIFEISVRDLKASHLRNIINNIKGSTKQITAIIAKGIMKTLVEDDIILKNPFMSVKALNDTKKQKRALTLDEQKIIFEAPLSQNKIVCLLMLLCGLRIGEAMAITRKDIDIKNKTVNVSKQRFTDGRIDEPKTKASIRKVPCPDYLILQIHQLSSISITPQSSDHGAIRKYLRNLGLDVTPHYLRHTYATNLYNSQVDMRTAQSFLGHTSIQMTMDIYTHLDEAHKKENAKTYNDYISSLTNK